MRMTTASRGSQYQLQILVNQHPDVLTSLVLSASAGLCSEVDRRIEWVSPKAPDYVEYYDGPFLDVLGLGHLRGKLADFWPNGGPHWDGLGRLTNHGGRTCAVSGDHTVTGSPASVDEWLTEIARMRAHLQLGPQNVLSLKMVSVFVEVNPTAYT